MDLLRKKPKYKKPITIRELDVWRVEFLTPMLGDDSKCRMAKIQRITADNGIYCNNLFLDAILNLKMDKWNMKPCSRVVVNFTSIEIIDVYIP